MTEIIHGDLLRRISWLNLKDDNLKLDYYNSDRGVFIESPTLCSKDFVESLFRICMGRNKERCFFRAKTHTGIANER